MLFEIFRLNYRLNFGYSLGVEDGRVNDFKLLILMLIERRKKMKYKD